MQIVNYNGDPNSTAANVLSAIKKDADSFVVVPINDTDYGAGFKWYLMEDSDDRRFEDVLVDIETFKILMEDPNTSQSGLKEADVLAFIAERLDILDIEIEE